MKKCKMIFLCSIVVSLFMQSTVIANDFEQHWAKETIQTLIDGNIINGYLDGSVKPDNYITRAEFFACVNKIFGFNQKSNINFNDVDNSKWYADVVSVAVGSGYVSGYTDNTIKAENNITRAEAAYTVQKITNAKSYENGIYKFKDYTDIDKWVKGAIGAVSKAGIINGYSDNTFGAKKNITRAEAFIMLTRAYDYKNGILETIEPTTETTTQFIKTETTTEQYSIPSIINNTDEWKKAIDYATDNLYNTLTLKINNFDNTTYDLKNLGYYNISVKADGTIKNNVAEITYKFDYSTNFKMLRARENANLSTKLTELEKSTMDKVKNIVSDIINDSMTDYEKEKAIHDYMVLNYKYDVEAIDKDGRNQSHEITGIVNTGVGVCEAYAYTFKLMADFAGLDTVVATGVMNGTVEHAWNIINIDGNNYHIDVTSDDPLPDTEGRILYNYFNLSDAQVGKTHSWQEGENIPCSGGKYNYFEYNNCVFETVEKLENYIDSQIKDGQRRIYFKTIGNILSSSEDIKSILKGKGLSGFKITGEFVENGTFMLEVE